MNLKRRLRWARGKGWTKNDFESRYRASAHDAWGYSQSAAHQRRFQLILDAIPERSFNVGVEVGCAEGQFSHLLASRVDRLVACDFSAEAVDRAMVRNTRHPNIEFVVHDIRDDPVVEHADLFVFSDVLYYLSPQEITNVIESTCRATEPGAVLLFANEWADHYRNLTSPDETIRRIERSGQWRLLSQSRLDTGPAATLTIACYERGTDASPSQ